MLVVVQYLDLDAECFFQAALYRIETRPEAVHTVVDQAVAASATLVARLAYTCTCSAAVMAAAWATAERLAAIPINSEKHNRINGLRFIPGRSLIILVGA